MKKWTTEISRRLPVAGSCDVAVVGGGIAGVAAAVAAARNGATVTLIEKECSLGGLATLGNVVVYLPLCDGEGNQVIKGLGEELLKLSIRDGYGKIPPAWKPGGSKKERIESRYRVQFNPASFMLALEELLLKENVALYYDTRFCDVVKTGSRIKALLVENKEGRSAILAQTVVDASGDADVCFRAGEPTVSLATNTASAWYFYQEGERVGLAPLHRPFDPYGKPPPENDRGFSGDRAQEVTQHMIASRNLIRKDLKQRTTTSDKPVYPLVIPTIPSFRMTRRLKGIVELDEAHERHCFEDSVGMTGDWRRRGPVYYIPLRALTAVRTTNLITAGRCISSRTAWDITRAIPTCAVTGEAAGTAAALAAKKRTPGFHNLHIADLQATLRSRKALVKKRIGKTEHQS